ncbi:MAG: tetratricopeptide repeat protein [Bacteroidia bacterium]
MKERQILGLIILQFVLCCSLAFGQKRSELEALLKTLGNCKSDTCLIANNSRIARKHIYFKEFDKAEHHLAMAKTILVKNKSEYGYANYFYAKGYLFNSKSNYDSAIYYFRRASQLFKKLGFINEQINIENNIGASYFYLGDLETALKIYSTCIEEKLKLKDEVFLIDLYNNIGGVYLYQGNTFAAKSSFEKSLNIAKKLNLNRKIINTTMNIGGLHLNEAKYAQALSYFFDGLKMGESQNDLQTANTALHNISACYLNMGKTVEAREYANRSIETAKKINEKRLLSDAYTMLGNINAREKKFNEAYEFYLKALDLKKEISEKRGIANLYLNLAQLSSDKDSNIVLALDFLKKAEAIKSEFGDPSGIVRVNNARCLIYFKAQNYDEAIKAALKSVEISKDNNFHKDLYYTYNLLASLHKNKKDYEKSIEYYQLSSKYRDSLNIEDNKQKSLELKYKYDFEKKEELAKVNYERDKAIAKLLLNKKQEELLIAEKDNAIKEYDIERAKLLLKQNEILSEKSKSEIQLLNKDMLIKNEEKKRTLAELNKEQSIRNYLVLVIALFGGLILIVLISLYQNKKNQKIILSQNENLEKKNVEIIQQKRLIEEKQKEIVDSINYAKRIQFALLTQAEILKKELHKYFILFKPKDIVSGDFYWATKLGNRFYFAVCDSTGHGVPGAFMSLLNIGFLSEAINEKGILEPGEVFNYVRKRLIENISNEGQKDGFDGILVCINKEDDSISYAAANNTPVFISNREIIELNKDKMPVGKGEKEQLFKTFELPKGKNGYLYLYTDGYPDQFGGPKGKKYKYKSLNNLLIQISDLENEKQYEMLDKEFDNWKGSLEQIDDVCVFGMKIS